MSDSASEGLRVGFSKYVHVMELSDRTVTEQGVDIAGNGLWLVVEDDMAGTLDVLAAVASPAAGRRILELIGGEYGPAPAFITIPIVDGSQP